MSEMASGVLMREGAGLRCPRAGGGPAPVSWPEVMAGMTEAAWLRAPEANSR